MSNHPTFPAFLKSLRQHPPTAYNWSFWWTEGPSIQWAKEELVCLSSPWNSSSSINYLTLLLLLLGSCTLKLTKLSLFPSMEMYTFRYLQPSGTRVKLSFNTYSGLIFSLTLITHTQLNNDSRDPWTYKPNTGHIP